MIVGEARIDPGLRIYAIGDVHGCVDQLRRLIHQIDEEVRVFGPDRSRIVFVGDYVDRGPANKETIEYLIELKNSDRDCVFLLGNHDERVLAFINKPALVWDDMMKWGGAQTLADYGVVPRPGEDSEEVSKRFASELPEDHLGFLESLKYSHSEGDYFFCHAGVRPGILLENQREHDLIWIRHDFLLHEKPFEKVVVHGHTPVDEPEVKPNRINVDTHCYNSGILTAAVLEAAEVRFLRT